MSDKSDSFNLTGEDITFVLTALEALREDIKSMLMDETTQAVAQLNIELIDSAKRKIVNREIQFSDNECRVMYIAALEMRDLMNKILDDKKSSEYDREMARSTLRSSNAMMRMLRKTFIENGIDIDDFLGG